jgi:hypothetical protein
MERANNFIIEEEFNYMKIGTLHNKKRVLKVLSNMIKNPGKSILSQSSSRSEAKAAYQFLNNDNLNMGELSQMHHFKTIERIVDNDSPILVIQDTCYVNYQSHAKEGLGKMSDKSKGVKLHSSIATTLDGLNLGVLHQKSLSMDISESEDEPLSDYELKKRPIEEKESYRWIESFKESMILMPDDIDITVISDREGDIYEYMSAVHSNKRYFLTRIAQNRMTEDNQKILDAIKKVKCEGEVIVKVPRNSNQKLQKRDATLEVRFHQYKIQRPQILNKTEKLPLHLPVYVVHVKEKKPPSGVEAIEWFLMTNRPIHAIDEAFDQVKKYMHRWKIERFHFVLKTGGCDIEKIQARSMKVTLTMIMMYSIISVFIMNITYAARLTPDRPCSDFFDEEEWKLLYCLIHKTGKPPEKPYSIKEAVRYITQIGGGKRAPSDGDPGVKAVWRGFEKFYLLFQYTDVIKLTVQV